MQFVIGFLLALSISAAARLLRSLSYSGALAAVVLGTIVYGFGGWQAALLLIAFFVSSSLVGRFARSRAGNLGTSYAKGAERDAGQVLGNGIVPGVLAIVMVTSAAGIWAWLSFGGAIAAVTADTWATELGALSSSAPRLITNLTRRVAVGTSGGVSLMGTCAAALGAMLIAALTGVLAPGAHIGWILPITIAGLVGALFDSLLGATVQSMYRCVAEGTETEQHPVHRCGSPTTYLRGWSWLNNDRVNLACAMLGALAAAAFGAVPGWL
jgi:uncharacterized protein (TIGR00297 family)